MMESLRWNICLCNMAAAPHAWPNYTDRRLLCSICANEQLFSITKYLLGVGHLCSIFLFLFLFFSDAGVSRPWTRLIPCDPRGDAPTPRTRSSWDANPGGTGQRFLRRLSWPTELSIRGTGHLCFRSSQICCIRLENWAHARRKLCT